MFINKKEKYIRTIEEIRQIFFEKGYTLLSEEYLGNKIPLIFVHFL